MFNKDNNFTRHGKTKENLTIINYYKIIIKLVSHGVT